MAISRRDFILGTSAAAGIATITLLVIGCGEDPEGDESCSDVDVEITDNHNHVLVIPIADVEAGEAKTYVMSGGSHSHEVEISGNLFEKLMNDGQVGLVSAAGNGHVHQLLLFC